MSKRLPYALLLLAVAAAAVNLRAGIASLGPVLDDVLAAFGASSSLAGAITAMPGILFGVLGLAAVPLATRVGLSRALFGGMMLTLLGLVARPWVGDVAVFLVLTACVVGGIAIGNVLLPAWVKNHGGRHAIVLMTVYSAGLGLSGGLGPLSAVWFAGHWQWVLFIWAFLAVIQIVVWAFVLPRTGRDIPGATPESGQQPQSIAIWRSPTARFLMLFFGLQAMNAYIQMGWLPKIYMDNGVSLATASVGLSIIGTMGIIGGLSMPGVIARVRDLRAFPAVFGVLTMLGYLGLWLAPASVPLLWSFLLGIGGWCFPMAIALIPARSRSPLVTARLSGFVQPLGYVIAGVGPFILGIVHERVASWDGILAALALISVLMAAMGMRAARRTVIDDELAHAAQ